MNSHERNEINTLLAYLRDFAAYGLIREYFGKHGNDAPQELLASQVEVVKGLLNRPKENPARLIQLRNGDWIRPEDVRTISIDDSEGLPGPTYYEVDVRLDDTRTKPIRFDTEADAIAYRDELARLVNGVEDKQ